MIADLALGMIRVTTRDRIAVSGVWLPFKLLYDELVRTKEIQKLSDLPIEEKLKYWKESEKVEASVVRLKVKRVWVCESLYMWDRITQ